MAARKTFASSVPGSFDSTRKSGVTNSGTGKRTFSSPLKFFSKRRRWSASKVKSVCIWICSQNSSAARPRPSIRKGSMESHQAPMRSIKAKSASSSGRTPGLMHLIATSVPSLSFPKKTSAMLPLAWGLASIDSRSTCCSHNVWWTSSDKIAFDHCAETCSCMRPSARQAGSGNKSRRVAAHCASLTKQGPHRSILAENQVQNVAGSKNTTGQ
mmetsp:Transcript_45460/g.82221  ORF Transcript_45460/g.82221 Transcript_45460/m.82221 type:complete len:213 (+) Transcript_45460:935-1573(+)